MQENCKYRNEGSDHVSGEERVVIGKKHTKVLLGGQQNFTSDLNSLFLKMFIKPYIWFMWLSVSQVLFYSKKII